MATQYSEPATGRNKDDQEGTGDDQGFWGSLRHDVASGYDTANNAVTTGLKDADLARYDPFNSWFGGDKSAPAAKPEDKKKDPASTEPTEATSEEDSAYENLANAQANQYLQMDKAMEPYTSGAAIPSFDSSMTSGAEKMLGTSSSSPISQWLNQQVQAAQAQYAPTQAAGATVAQAEQAGAGLVAGGLKQMGQAETAQMQVAPYEGLLQSLATDVPYKLLDNYDFSKLSTNIPAAVQMAESNLGITTAGQGTGVSAPSLPAPTTNPAATNTLVNPDLPSGGGQT